MADTEKQLRDRILALEIVLQECEEYFDKRADADFVPGDSYFTPNEEMRLKTMIDEVIPPYRPAT